MINRDDDDTEPYAFGSPYPGDYDIEEKHFIPPVPGSASLLIYDKIEPLFISATWTIIASVNGTILEKSKESNKPHTQDYLKRWSRYFIRTHASTLKNLGVDIDLEYQKWGGTLEDLSP